MKDKAAPGKAPAAGPMEILRQQAEKIAQGKKKVDRLGENLDALLPADAQHVLHDLQVHQIELELQNEELRRAQEALEASRARYFDLYDLAPVGYFTLNEGGLILEANLAGANLLGVARSALVNQPLGRFVVGDDADTYYLNHRQLFATGEPQAFELRLAKKGGAPFPAWIDATVTTTEGGARICRKVVSDISERKAIQEKLRESQSLLQTAGKMAQVGGWSIKFPNNDLTWSDEMGVILDYPKGTIPSFTEALSLYTPGSYAVISEALRLCTRDGIPFDCELEIVTVKRRRIDVRAIGQPVRDRNGSITGIEGAFQDITERKKAEQGHASLGAQLRESQKMEALGTLAGGIAHDFNNILGTILGNAELARHDARANWQALVSLEEILKAGNRAKDLVQQILSFSRRQPTSRRVLSLTAIVEESVRLLRAALPVGVRIDCRCALDTPSIFADPTQVQQVLLNIGNNATHAMEGRPGTIDFRVEGVTVDKSSARLDLNLRPGRYACVTISDVGHGMNATIRRRIFEPFFTTKAPGKGTGLGLSVAHGIMQAHEGAIVAHSESGKGSTFKLYFPPAREVAATLGIVEDAGAASEGKGEHILYVDDDEAQVFLVKRMLERWGYRVSAYLEQREALDALLADAPHFDLVLTDFNMPGMSGLEVARAIRDVRPDLPVVVLSGYITDDLRAQAAAVGVRELIAKPHEVEELRDTVHRLLKPRVTIKPEPA